MAFLISDLQLGKPDMRGNPVQEIYSIASDRYAVYRALDRVSVMFADDMTEATRQRDVFAPLEILRGDIAGLMEGWVNQTEGSRREARVQSYNRRLADALILAFRDLPEPAMVALQSVKTDILRERVAVGRREYMTTAVGVGLALVIAVAVLLPMVTSLGGTAASLPLTWVVGSGCFGALFSIMLDLSARQIMPDLLRSENLLDATLRVTIGGMSALVLYALLKAGLIAISLQGVEIGVTPDFGMTTFVASVLAGFSERLVGNYLGGAALAASGAAAAAAASAATDKAVSRAVKAASPAAGGQGSSPAGGPVPRTGALPAPDAEPDPPPEDLHVDGCVCDIHADDDDGETDDVELPPSRGGVEA